MGWAEGALAAYVAVLALLSVNGLYRLWMVAAWLRRAAPVAPPLQSPPPRVTVQIPLYNERYVADRVISAVGALRYPADRLQIQILDDSTDDTTEIVAGAAQRLRDRGLDVCHVHRTDRTGFKAGALAHGLGSATGELVAIFDADFVPTPDFLEATVPWFADPGLGLVQARWGHLNATDSPLTEAQSVLLDGHFAVEQTARTVLGRWFNFNGTAGVWRRRAIEDGGGWEHDTLTEDLDLSYRSQMAGWRFRFLWWVVAPAELPSDMAAFKSQQHRWSAGSVQTSRKLLARIWRCDASLGNKVEATLHLGATYSYPLVVLLTVLVPLATAARAERTAVIDALGGVDVFLFPVAILPFLVFFCAAIAATAGDSQRRPLARLLRLPVVLALGLGMALWQTRAVLHGFFGPVGTFVRTPKRGAGGGGYRVESADLAWVEIGFAAYVACACAYAVSAGFFGSVPFLLLFVVGYSWVGWASLRQAKAKATSAGTHVDHHSHGDSAQRPVPGSKVMSTE